MTMEIKEGGTKAVETGKERKERAENRVSMEIGKAKGMRAESTEPKRDGEADCFQREERSSE